MSFQIASLKKCIFATVRPTLLPSFLLFVLKGKTRCPKDYESPTGLSTGQIDDFPRVTGLPRIKARPPSVIFGFCFCRVAALRESQSQELNSKLLRDKL